MKPGFYLSESSNFQIWYPRGYFKRGRTTLEVMAFNVGEWITVHYTDSEIETLKQVLDFEYLGDL